MAHAIARKLNVTPWQALLEEIKRTAGVVAWLQMKLGETEDDEQLLRDTTDEDENGLLLSNEAMRPWYRMYVNERQWLGRVSKMALDAGVAERLVTQAQTDVRDVVRLITETFEAVGLTAAQWDKAHDILKVKLLEVMPRQDAIEGEVVDVRDRTYP